MRRFQQEQALKRGGLETSGHTTFAALYRLCRPYAPLKGRPMSPAQELLIRRETADIAAGHFDEQPALGRLSVHALAGVLQQLVAELSALPESAAAILDWLTGHREGTRLHQLGRLGNLWRVRVSDCGYADRIDVNRAVLHLLRGARENWPPRLRDAESITFRAVRWLDPFEETCVAVLSSRLRVQIESALPPAHAEQSEDRLGQRIRSGLMAEPWAIWTEDLGDALAVDSASLLQPEDAARIQFSRSAGSYGEIEDLARRICRHLENGAMPPDRIALVVPDIGAVQDIIPHVFSRFRIPYYFRRGRPVLSSPCVKALLAWLTFPLRPERDVLIDLVRNPALRFERREEESARLLKSPPLIRRGGGSTAASAEQALRTVRSGREALEVMKARVIEPADHFNREALKAVAAVLEALGGRPMPLQELMDLAEELLAEATIKPRDSHEQGVWILNPHDAVGLEFDLVLLAGLNEGAWPAIPQQDALLQDAERYRLCRHLEEQGRPLPKMSLPSTGVRMTQETVRFLCTLGMAREQLVLSCQAVDQEGGEKRAGDYFERLWHLAGWPAADAVRPGAYDIWRIEQAGADSIFSAHLEAQCKSAPAERVPMPGESFLPIVPLPLCRAQDEALQAAVLDGEQASLPADLVVDSAAPRVRQVVDTLRIEAEREAWLETTPDERAPSIYCGQLPGLQDRIAAWFDARPELSATTLETLAQCRYLFFVERILGLDEKRVAGDLPDPLERGSLLHAVLRDIYQAIAEGAAGIDTPRLWAVRRGGGWERSAHPEEGGIPLAVFLPEHREAYAAFTRQVAERAMSRAALGHPDVWLAEQQKVMECILNLVRHDAETCAAENRCPALLELTFGDGTAVDLGAVRVRGRIDRADLLFDDAGRLRRLRVLDYKSSSRSRQKREQYVGEIRRNLNCQLPIYAFAAQQHFFGEYNTPRMNALTEAGYLFFERKYADVGRKLAQSLLPLDEEGMTADFLETLHQNIERLKVGDFAVDPLIRGYTDRQSLCRVEAVSLDELE